MIDPFEDLKARLEVLQHKNAKHIKDMSSTIEEQKSTLDAIEKQLDELRLKIERITDGI